MGSYQADYERILIVFNESLDEVLLDIIRQKFPGCEVKFYHSSTSTPVPAEVYRRATVLVTFYHFPDIENGKHLKLIQTLTAGLDLLVGLPIAKETDIPITNSSGIHGPPMAEWTIMNWLVASRKYDQMRDDQAKHRWADRQQYIAKVHDQVGKKVGILGYGSIGRQIACLCKALGMTVYAYTASPRPTAKSRHDNGHRVPGTGDPEGVIPEAWYNGLDKASIHSFLSLGLDHLVVCLPLTTQTHDLIGVKELGILSRNCRNPYIKPYITNISRGKVINQDALAVALESEQIAFAALDVPDPEPLPRSRYFWDVPNKQISPHISCMGREYFPRSLDIMKENLGRIANGERLINAYERGKQYQ